MRWRPPSSWRRSSDPGRRWAVYGEPPAQFSVRSPRTRHCIVTGGALRTDADRWIGTHPRFLLPVRVMGKLFRGKMLDALVRAVHDGKPRVHDAIRFDKLVGRLYRKNWNVYSKRPFGGAEQVIATSANTRTASPSQTSVS